MAASEAANGKSRVTAFMEPHFLPGDRLSVPKAEVAVPCELFAAILDRIQRLGVPPPLLRRG